MAVIRKASANPTKAFFVRMITRDISLEDCVLDLIDNSIDGAWQLEGARPMSLSSKADLSKYKIELEASPEHFKIIDNCGGISLDEAAEYAFTFGRKDSDPHEKYSIGVYGIGMKRAVFKIGGSIRVRSTYEIKRGKSESFAVPIDVQKWLEDDESSSWDFDIEPDAPLGASGVEIDVKHLTEGTSTSFDDPGFIQKLRRTISRDYAIHLHSGMKTFLNSSPIEGWAIEMRTGQKFAPMRIEYKDNNPDGMVTVEILAGMAAPPPESAEPDESDEKESRSGWYVVCNGRIVLAADKTTISGWGTDQWPKWHPQYEGFLGFVFFSSENAKQLPLTTTKRSVDSSSSVYRRAMPRMRDVSKEWISYTNVRKQTIEEAKDMEAAAKPISIYEIKMRETVTLPSLSPKTKEKLTTISYSMPPKRVKALANGLGNINMSNRDVGIGSFEYAYADLAEDD